MNEYFITAKVNNINANFITNEELYNCFTKEFHFICEAANGEKAWKMAEEDAKKHSPNGTTLVFEIKDIKKL